MRARLSSEDGQSPTTPRRAWSMAEFPRSREVPSPIGGFVRRPAHVQCACGNGTAAADRREGEDDAVALATSTTERALVRRVREESGAALVLALVVLAALGAAATTAIVQASSSGRTAAHARADQTAFSLAEAGLGNALAVLSLPSNNALNPSLLPSTRTDLEGGYVIWSGTLDATGTWKLDATGYATNPTGPGTTPVTRHVGETVGVQPSYQQPLNNMAWNYIWAKSKLGGSSCDMAVGQSVNVSTPLVVEGNLCLFNTAVISRGPLVVKGNVYLNQKQNQVGAPSAKIEAHIGGGCQLQNGSLDVPCKGAPDNVFGQPLDQAIPSLTAPQADWTSWYLNASPGPYYPCATSSGTPPVFDTDQYGPGAPSATYRNGSLNPTPFNLTPPVSYSCKTAGGEISWDATKDVLTLNGTVYIDGSAYVSNGAVNQYQGVGSLYLSGTLLLKNSFLCAGRTASGCNTASWDPNKQMLVIVADGDGASTATGGQVSAGDGIQLVSATFQGALYATKAIETDTTSQVDGPMVGWTVKLGQTVNTTFPVIKIVPTGMPSNPVVYAQPMTPTNFSG